VNDNKEKRKEKNETMQYGYAVLPFFSFLFTLFFF